MSSKQGYQHEIQNKSLRNNTIFFINICLQIKTSPFSFTLLEKEKVGEGSNKKRRVTQGSTTTEDWKDEVHTRTEQDTKKYTETHAHTHKHMHAGNMYTNATF